MIFFIGTSLGKDPQASGAPLVRELLGMSVVYKIEVARWLSGLF
jgi:hypothetical protein